MLNRTRSPASINDFRQVSLNTLSKSWFSFFTIMLILLGLGSLLLYVFALYFPIIIISIISVVWFISRLNRLNKIKDLRQFKIPNYIWNEFEKRHPLLSRSAYPYIEDGFKDYIALHMWKRNAYAMPSKAVDELWHLLLEEFEAFYTHICLNYLGYVLKHKPHDTEPTALQRADQRKQLVNTWQGACHLHGLNPQTTQVLPRLFQIDVHLHWQDGLAFSLPFLIMMYEQTMSATSVVVDESLEDLSHSSCTSSTTSCSSCSGSSSESSHSSNHSSSDSSSSCSSCSSCSSGSSD